MSPWRPIACMEAPHARSARTSPCSCAERHCLVAHQRVHLFEPCNGCANRRRTIRRSARGCVCPFIRAHICTSGRSSARNCAGGGRGLPAADRGSPALAPRAGTEIAVRRVLGLRGQSGEALCRTRVSGGARHDPPIRGRRRGRRDPHEHRPRHGGRGGVGFRRRRAGPASARGGRTRPDVQHPGRALLHSAGWITRWDGR